jgi:hypothetical protein
MRVEYADAAHTTTDYGYDVRRRVRTVQTYRGPPSIWTAPPQSYFPAPNLHMRCQTGERPGALRCSVRPAAWPIILL